MLAHDVNATVVGGVQLQNHLSHVVGAIDAAGEGKDRRGLSCTRWTVQKEVREAVGVDELVDCGEDILVARDIGEGCWTVFLDPESVNVSDSSRKCTRYRVLLRKLTHHGKLSSASTGKLAALRLPLAVLSEENVMSLEGAGTSTSISSSKSDILNAGGLSRGRDQETFATGGILGRNCCMRLLATSEVGGGFGARRVASRLRKSLQVLGPLQQGA